MAIKNNNQGIALLVAVIFMGVMLAFALSIGVISYKQSVLAGAATESQYAFYAADAALECALYHDQQLDSFAFPASNPGTAPPITCNGDTTPETSSVVSYSASQWVVTERLSVGTNACADVWVYKPPDGIGGVTWIFSQGYNVKCADLPGAIRYAARGLNIHY